MPVAKAIKRITQRMDPRVARVVALLLQQKGRNHNGIFRDLYRLPAGGEIVLFDRSWYNRAGVKELWGSQEQQIEEFFNDVPELNVCWFDCDNSIKVLVSISDEEQQIRLVKLDR